MDSVTKLSDEQTALLQAALEAYLMQLTKGEEDTPETVQKKQEEEARGKNLLLLISISEGVLLSF